MRRTLARLAAGIAVLLLTGGLAAGTASADTPGMTHNSVHLEMTHN